MGQTYVYDKDPYYHTVDAFEKAMLADKDVMAVELNGNRVIVYVTSEDVPTRLKVQRYIGMLDVEIILLKPGEIPSRDQ